MEDWAAEAKDWEEGMAAEATVEAAPEEAAEKEAVAGCTATADRSVSTRHVADSKESAEGLYTVDVKITNRTRRNRDELTRLIRFATPADFPLRECTAYIGLHVRRESAGGVPRSMENANCCHQDSS